MAKFDMGSFAKSLAREPAPVPETRRDIEVITGEIVRLKQDAGNAILGIGQRLIEAKALLPRGEWLPWLTERVEFSERTAQNFMVLAREWSNPQALADLGATKALTLLALPPEERETFMEEHNVIDMTSRELKKAIRERDEARQEAAQTGEELIAAQEAEAEAREDLDRVRAELDKLRKMPVEVAVETVVDRDAVEKARRDAVADMQAKLDLAEEQRRAAEKALEDAKTQTASSPASVSWGLRDFQTICAGVRENLNQLRGMLIMTRGRCKDDAKDMERALLELAEFIRKCAE